MENNNDAFLLPARVWLHFAQQTLAALQKHLDHLVLGVDILRAPYMPALEFVRVARVDYKQPVDFAVEFPVEHLDQRVLGDHVQIVVFNARRAR